ncbi:N-acetylmuramic acid 6-phosphate etherase [Enterococcus sp. BWB1-3]|uniref:N-acetylmuramic acid 6-phosphate etherase n=1 Tax=unclassified Enterococcus TaxID=2608891 RepID=UPI001920B579|nr:MULTISPECIES: N-acetylmuramic acid 6-phosphate etherase [unclassified Enterococcus]MBL1228004.1 N-acetylmuramic acid 6-phosphate etherase [Enterococcus sp. BWB1-3]MCB5954041.1 N-acetylmuramic acid 6-phosphate etherase [Enterococcus sp. CWB-B31]
MEINQLTTETRNINSQHIDRLTTAEMVKIINNEDKKVAEAVEKALPEIAKAIDLIAERFKKGGRLIYCGAGTSGRLGTLDAIELTPTYSVSPKQAFGILAGGKEAMYEAVEGAEDSKELAVNDLKSHQLTDQDVVIAIAASGRTPYAISAVEYGNQLGALTVSVTCNKDGVMNQLAQIGIAAVVGPEIITGSTRMKAGTAQKMILNMLSTGVMIKAGKVYQNLMVNVQPTNLKLIQRSISIIREATGSDAETAEQYLRKAENHVAAAIVMIETGRSLSESEQSLKENNDRIAQAINELQKKS